MGSELDETGKYMNSIVQKIINYRGAVQAMELVNSLGPLLVASGLVALVALIVIAGILAALPLLGLLHKGGVGLPASLRRRGSALKRLNKLQIDEI